MKANVPKEHVNTRTSCHSIDSQHEADSSNQSGVVAITVLGAINLNMTAVGYLSAAALDGLLVEEFSVQLSLHSDIMLSNLVSPVTIEASTITQWMR